MAFRIKPQEPVRVKVKPVSEAGYLDFVRKLPCAVTGASGVEAAHLSTGSFAYGHNGRGKQQKASDRWAIPLCPQSHREQHSMNEMRFWQKHNINPHVLALSLYGAWQEQRENAEQACVKILELQRRIAG